VDGVRLYDLARQGKTVERVARPITVYEMIYEQGDEATQTFTFSVSCSKGTYIRSLIDDMGKALGCGAVMTALCRTKACGFALEECVDLEAAKEMTPQELLLPVSKAVEGYPAVRVTQSQAKRFANGGPLDLGRLPLSRHATGIFRVYTPTDELLGLGYVDPEKNELKIQCFL
jgi:tRNA pseudouridine55 synthase